MPGEGVGSFTHMSGSCDGLRTGSTGTTGCVWPFLLASPSMAAGYRRGASPEEPLEKRSKRAGWKLHGSYCPNLGSSCILSVTTE